MILCWDKPKKVMTAKQREDTYSSDCGVPGTFVPNMSDDDRGRWKAKLVGHKAGHPQVEIRKDSFVVVVALTGYKYKFYNPENTKGVFMHIASAGPIQFTAQDWDDMKAAVDEAKDVLMRLT